jgi:hypothetical protein
VPHVTTARLAPYLLLAFALGAATASAALMLPRRTSAPPGRHAIVIDVGDRDVWVSTGEEDGAQVARLIRTTPEKVRAAHQQALDALTLGTPGR